ncbi:MAG: ROK family protein, partial [Phycisphaerae bacterium]|nr:ROK family protein [Phycisphaerae bacterium]
TQADQGVDHVIDRMAGFVGELIKLGKVRKASVAGVGVGAPGPMSHSAGIIIGAPNLPGWKNVPLRDRLRDATGLPTTLENDANAAAFGEFSAGAGKDVRSLVMLTLGTGVGGGVVMDGQLWRGHFDNAGEIGHTIIVPRGRPCPCGQSGCLERYASANAVGERLVEAVKSGEPSSLKPRIAAGESITSRDVLEAMNAGDALALQTWDEACFYLALACVNVQHCFNPELIVLAGGLINAGDKLLDPVRQHFESLHWHVADDAPEIVFATLGTDAGTIGAAMLAQHEAQ